MGCNCGAKATAKARSGAKFTVKQTNGTTRTFTSEADAKLSAAKNGTRVQRH